MNTSITGKDLLTMVNSSRKISRILERQSKHALSMHAMSSLMGFLEKESQQYSSSPTRINALSIWSKMECGISSPLQNHKIKRRSGIFFYIILNSPCNTWKASYRVFWKAQRRTSILFRTWRGQKCTWGVLCQTIFFRGYWHWCRWQQPDLRSMSPPWPL